MKKHIILIFALLFVSFSYGITEEYNGWIYNNNEFSFDGNDYNVIISKGGSSIVLVSDESLNIELEKCQKTDFRKFCYNASFYDTSIKEYKALLIIYHLKPVITIEREISDTEIEVGETSEITVTLENTGDEETLIDFYDELPKNAKITNVDNAEIYGNSVIWQGEIEPDETYEINYEIKSIGSYDIYTKARAKYFDGIKETTVFSTEANLVSLAPLEFELTLNKEEYELNEEVNLTLEIINNPKDDVDLNLELLLPENVELIKEPSSFKNLKFFDEINNDTEFLFILKPKEISNKVLILKGNYYYKQDYEFEERIDFDLEDKGITITSSLEDNAEADSGKPIRIQFRAKNDNKYANIKNIKIGVNSELGILNTTMPLIKANKTSFLINTEIKSPIINSTKTYPIKLNVTYETEDGKKYSKTYQESLIVKPIAGLKIEISGNSESYENEPIEITASLENPTKEDITKILTSAKIPDFFKIKGVTKAYTEVNASKSITALSFTLIPDYVNFETEYNITINAEYENNYVTKAKSIKIKPKKPEITFARTISSSSVYPGDIIDVTYSVGNTDEIDLFELIIIPGKSQNFDTINIFEINITDLVAGKKITLEGEKVRAKKTGKLEKAVLFFKDSRGRLFNKTTDESQIEVKEGAFNSPAIFIGISKVNSTVKYNISNIGKGKASNNNKEIEDKIYYETAKNDEYQHFIEYDYNNLKARAYSNVLSVLIKEDKISEEVLENPKSENNDNSEKEAPKEEKKTGIWIKMYEWFIGLFR